MKWVEDMTDEECKKYVEEAETDEWWKELVQSELADGITYRQIAFIFQNF